MTRTSKQPHSSLLLFSAIIVCLAVMTACSRSNINTSDEQNGFVDVKEEANNLNSYDNKGDYTADAASFTFYTKSQFIDQMNLSGTLSVKEVYSDKYQQKALEQLEAIKSNKTYTIENPLFIENPFGTNDSGLYAYFGQPQEKVNISYTISVDDPVIPDYTDTMYINRTSSLAAEGQIIGLIPGRTNKVTIQINNVDGRQLSRRSYFLSIADRTSYPVTLDAKVLLDSEPARGLFSFFVNGSEESSYFLFYDNYGILRASIPTSTQIMSAKIEQINNRILYPCGDNQYADVNNLGHVTFFYEWPEAGNLIDFSCDEENGIVLFIEEDIETKNRFRVLALDLKSKEWKINTDFRNLIPDYQTVFSGSSGDWLGLESIQVVNGKDYVISANETNTIFRVNNIYLNPVIRWMIGPENIWKGTDYESLLLVETGEKLPISEKDSIMFIQSKKLKEEQGYLAFIDYHQNEVEDSNSYFIKYLVDENTNRYRIVQKIAFPFHINECASYVYGTHVILCLGEERTITEYNEKGEMMLQMTIPDINFSQWIKKYTMDRYWF